MQLSQSVEIETLYIISYHRVMQSANCDLHYFTATETLSEIEKVHQTSHNPTVQAGLREPTSCTNTKEYFMFHE